MNSTRRWLLRIVGLLAVLVVADISAGVLRITYWTPFENHHALRIFAYQHEMPRADILFLGTSRIRTAVMPAVIEKALSSRLGRDVSTYCLGQDSSTAYTSWLVLDDAVAAHGPPEMIVLEVFPASLNSNHHHVARDLRYYSSISEIVRAARWIDSRDRLSAAAGGSFRGFSSLVLYGSRWLYARDFESDLARHRRRKGAQFPRTITRQHRRLSDLDANQRHALLDDAVPYARKHYMGHFEVGGAPEAGFRAIIDLARTRGIPLVLVDPPVIPDYREAVCSPEENAEYRETLDRALRDPRPSLVEADLSGLELTEDDFLDLTHLNPWGASKFSRYVAREILLPVMRDEGVGSRE